MFRRSLAPVILSMTSSLVFVQCEQQKPSPVEKKTAAPVVETPKPEMAAASSPKVKIFWTEELLHKEIKFHNPGYEGNAQFQIENGEPYAISLAATKVENLKALQGRPLKALDLSDTAIVDLSPLKGMPLVELYLERSKVQDLSPLRGLPIQKLYLTSTQVSNVAALEGMPLVELNAVDARIVDLSPLRHSPITMLWLTGCPVVDVTPLHGLPLVSVTLLRTKVKDLSPFSGTKLQRLHIGETPVEDLSPLKDVPLTRLVFTPAHIKAGLEVIKALPLQEIGTQFDDSGKDLSAPDVFWAKMAAPATK